MSDDEMIKVWRARPSCASCWCYDDSLPSLTAMIEDGAETGNAYELECVEMTKAALEDMGDFPGW